MVSLFEFNIATEAIDEVLLDVDETKGSIIQSNGLTRRLLTARSSLRGRRVNKKRRTERQGRDIVDEAQAEVSNIAGVNSEALKDVVRNYKRVCSEVACWDEIIIT